MARSGSVTRTCPATSCSALSSVNLDKAVVSGNVTAGTAITGNGTIGGTATANSPSPTLVAPAVAACSPYSSGRASEEVHVQPRHRGPDCQRWQDGNPGCRDVLLPQRDRLRWSSLPSLARSRSVLRGLLEAGGGSLVNQTHVPANLQVESSYAGVDGVALSGGTGAYVTVYAPQTSITLSGKSPLYGALLGKTVARGWRGDPLRRPDARCLGELLRTVEHAQTSARWARFGGPT